MHASVGGNLVAFGLYGTDMVAVVDTRTDTLLGPWDTNPAATNGRAHAGVFSRDGTTLYVASDASNEVIALDPRTGEVFWRMNVPGAHELAVTHERQDRVRQSSDGEHAERDRPRARRRSRTCSRSAFRTRCGSRRTRSC